jgi:ADP-heptose:LPS heptosyltransferase
MNTFFNDIDGVLSIISACDLIITTSNSTAHLAGALGKETLLLTPYSVGKFWYWQDIDGVSLWYPSVRVFPQTKQGDWVTPINSMKAYLEKRVEEKPHAPKSPLPSTKS